MRQFNVECGYCDYLSRIVLERPIDCVGRSHLAARISFNPAKPGLSAPPSLYTSNPTDGALRRVRRR